MHGIQCHHRAYNRLEGEPSLMHGVTQLANRNSAIKYVKEISSLARHIIKQMREELQDLFENHNFNKPKEVPENTERDTAYTLLVVKIF